MRTLIICIIDHPHLHLGRAHFFLAFFFTPLFFFGRSAFGGVSDVEFETF